MSFRLKLLVAMMVVVALISALVLYFAERDLAAGVEDGLQRDFRGELATLHNEQMLRQAALVERCRALVRRPRIHAALEDGALDLLYPSAKDELHDIMETPGEPTAAGTQAYALHAEFYRFLSPAGTLIGTAPAADAGRLSPAEEAALTLPGVPEHQQVGYLARRNPEGAIVISEIIAMPIISSETGQIIAAVVVGFRPVSLGATRVAPNVARGIWLEGRLHMAPSASLQVADLEAQVAAAIASAATTDSAYLHTRNGDSHQFFFKQLNPRSLYPSAYEINVYPLADLLVQQRRLRWQVLSTGAILLLAGLLLSHFLSGRLSRPVEKLAVTSAENLVQRARAEAALESTSEELQRAARFSADASHQLKTPVAVLRAGLEALQARENFRPEICHEVSTLIHQTYRLSSVIDDLLLLSRMDAGRLKLKFVPVDLSQLIEAALDDLGAQADILGLAVETDFPPAMQIAGEKHYVSLILQNLLENARKYNRPGGRIRLAARVDGEQISLLIGNTGQPIPATAQARIFERFHRGAIGENVPGYGLGLNLARELARLHQGDLRLLSSQEDWTEFEVRFCALRVAATAPEVVA